MKSVARELIKIAKEISAYNVDDPDAIDMIVSVLGKEGLKYWNGAGTWLVDFHYKSKGFANKVTMASHNVGSRMTNLEPTKRSLDDLWKYIMEAEKIIHNAAIRAMDMFNLDFIEKQGYEELKDQLWEAKSMTIDLRDSKLFK